MLKDIKLGFKLLRYGYKLKLNVIMLVFFAIFGIASEIFSKGTSIIGGVYFMMSGMFTFQLIMSMDVSELIQSTSLKKKPQDIGRVSEQRHAALLCTWWQGLVQEERDRAGVGTGI
jgi:hypothetical protein